MGRNKQLLVGLLFGITVMSYPLQVLAQSSSSPNYKVDQTLFGTGGELDGSSANYRSRQTVGELGVGNTVGNAYQAYAGFNTNDEPFIEFVITGDNIDLGYLSTDNESTASGTFYVRAWRAGGYVVRTESNPPTNTSGGYQITPMSGASSSPGTEQFGINLRQNTAPAVGAEPQQVPDSTFSFGQVYTGYDVVNQFKYAKGDIVAHASKSTSVTIYTISYLFNIDLATPAGQYEFNHVLVATGTY